MYNKSSARRMRFSGPTGGNSTKWSVLQLPLLESGRASDSLLKGSVSAMAVRSSRKIATTERVMLG